MIIVNLNLTTLFEKYMTRVGTRLTVRDNTSTSVGVGGGGDLNWPAVWFTFTEGREVKKKKGGSNLLMLFS